MSTLMVFVAIAFALRIRRHSSCHSGRVHGNLYPAMAISGKCVVAFMVNLTFMCATPWNHGGYDDGDGAIPDCCIGT